MLVNDGTGICNAVYIDDVVTALCLGATSERAAGERFLISGPEHPTWRAFYAAFERMLGVQRMVPMSEAEALALWQRSQRRETLLSLALQTVRQDAVLRQRMLATREGLVLRWAIERLPLKYLAQRAMRPRRSTAVNANVEHLPLSPLRPWLVRYLASKPRVNIEKARRVVGYEPMFELAEGMRLTESWARWAKLAP
jgi:nucleoside-diphosphate-sugar epimerase